MADVNYMMKGIERAMERQKKQALVAEKQPPVAAKAPKKVEEPELKSNLTQEEVQYYVNMIHEANARSPSHPNNPTNRIIRERLEAMGLQPTSAE
ncbi:hypothetical protein IEG05_12840 [Pseudomonas kunmingensis]|uniref:hypothetical protein n=1 Tax=Stutzerimonas kunmingensis TaxID=1211807 RepID=UPI001746919A|nr:hypothetical protein [Stutzerimonas kunmingensis]MBD3876114.1 hypothetical protein [Stutzerimonas kunmingensis]